MDTYPYLVRRARLLMGEKEAEFAKRFGVDEATISGWERGKDLPPASDWSWIRESIFHSSNLLSEAVKTARTLKCIVPLDDLTRPTLVSRGIEAALARIGIEPKDLTGPFFANLARSSPHYDISGIKALSMIQSNQDWIRGEVLFAEAHCYSPAFKTWLDGVIAPLPHTRAALIEGAPSTEGEKGGFWVRFVKHGEVASPKGGNSQIIQ
ncbi:MAG: hypothetical protein WBX25_05795 [Rhodomicrobium sp.]